MDFLRLFWDAACKVDVNAVRFDEGIRFPVCNADALRMVFHEAGLTGVKTAFLDINTVFKNFDDYWNPFLGGQGPAPGYLASINKDLQDQIKNTIFKKLSVGPNDPIQLLARAIAVSGIYEQ